MPGASAGGRLSRRPFTAIFVGDIDELKTVNDTQGHKKGDKLIVAAAHLIKDCFRKSDIVSRIGGDEFAILLTRCSEDLVKDCLKRLDQKVRDYNRQNELGLSLSFGYALENDPLVDIDTVFKRADDKMYQRKILKKSKYKNDRIRDCAPKLEELGQVFWADPSATSGQARELGRTLRLPADKLANLDPLAKFQDLGNAGLDPRVLNKPGRLTAKEFKAIKAHCQVGKEMALSIPQLKGIAELILMHHERWDGQGYPLGLNGKDIPIECRIIGIVNAYQAMVNDRPYRKRLPQKQALSELKACAGGQFDPDLVPIFLELV